MADQRVLVIDDEECVRDAFIDALEDMQCTVVAAPSGMEGVRQVESGLVNLIFLDLKMPNMDGVETLRRIRAVNKEVPVYVVTAFHAEFLDKLQSAEDEGLVFELLHKPIGHTAIRKVTSSVLGLPQFV